MIYIDTSSINNWGIPRFIIKYIRYNGTAARKTDSGMALCYIPARCSLNSFMDKNYINSQVNLKQIFN